MGNCIADQQPKLVKLHNPTINLGSNKLIFKNKWDLEHPVVQFDNKTVELEKKEREELERIEKEQLVVEIKQALIKLHGLEQV